MIDLNKEVIYSLAALRKKLPVKRSYKTVMRWCRDGLKVGGRRKNVLMEYVVVAGSRYSSLEAFQRFVAECTKYDRGADA
jgi:hypothetical protein